MLLIRYLIDNHRELLEIAIAIHAAAALVVNLTPTPRDNEVVHRCYRVLEILAGIVTPQAKR